MALPTSEVVAVENGDDVGRDVLIAAPTGDTNHVLCRGSDEPLGDFGRRIEWRLRALRKESSIQKVSYLVGSRPSHDWLDCRPALAAVIGLLSSGAEFELVASSPFDVDVLRTLEELMAFAKVGVRVRIRQDRAGTTAAGNQRPDRMRSRAWTHDAPALPGVVNIASATSNARDAQYLA